MVVKAGDIRTAVEKAFEDGIADIITLDSHPYPQPTPRFSVPEGQTPLNDKLGHRLLDVIEEGRDQRDSGEPNRYHGHSLEHCIHACGWVQQDLRIALDKARTPAGKLTP